MGGRSLVRRFAIADLVLPIQGSDMTAKIRWGVLGYARIARENVIPAIVRSSNSTFHALASRDEAKLVEGRARFDVPRCYASYDELLRDDEIDAVYIPLPNSLHAAWTIKAAEQGKHVLCEKPLALNATECRRMIDVCESRRVLLMEAFMYRYTDRTKKVLQVLRSGELGEIKFINSSFRFLLADPASIKFKPELGGGSLYDVGCYPLNFVGMVMDEISGGVAGGQTSPESVSVSCVRAGGVDVIFSALLKYGNGVIAGLNCGFNAHRRVFSEIVGTQGVLEIPDTFFDSAGSLILTIGDHRREIAVEACDRYRLEVEDFADAILQGRAPHLKTAESWRNLEIMDRLFAAAK